jgi:hypothetical protein
VPSMPASESVAAARENVARLAFRHRARKFAVFNSSVLDQGLPQGGHYSRSTISLLQLSQVWREVLTRKGGTVQLRTSERIIRAELPCTRIFENSQKNLRRARIKKILRKWQAQQGKNLVFQKKIRDSGSLPTRILGSPSGKLDPQVTHRAHSHLPVNPCTPRTIVPAPGL